MKKLLSISMMMFLMALSAKAEELCYVAYEEFELMVPHANVMVCPDESLSISDYFCRIALKGETLTLYTFQFEENYACLINAEEMPFAKFKEKYGTSYEYE